MGTLMDEFRIPTYVMDGQYSEIKFPDEETTVFGMIRYVKSIDYLMVLHDDGRRMAVNTGWMARPAPAPDEEVIRILRLAFDTFDRYCALLPARVMDFASSEEELFCFYLWRMIGKFYGRCDKRISIDHAVAAVLSLRNKPLVKNHAWLCSSGDNSSDGGIVIADAHHAALLALQGHTACFEFQMLGSLEEYNAQYGDQWWK